MVLVGSFRNKNESEMSGSKLFHYAGLLIMHFANLQICLPARAKEIGNERVTAILISRTQSCKKSKRACDAGIFVCHLICPLNRFVSVYLMFQLLTSLLLRAAVLHPYCNVN